MSKKKIFLVALCLLIFPCSFIFSAPLFSHTWGFTLDLPVCYEFTGGDGRDQFSFENPDGARFDIIIHHTLDGGAAPFPSVEALAQDVHTRLRNNGNIDFFVYRGKNAALIELSFMLPGAGPMTGWALAIELGQNPQTRGTRPKLLALAYGPAARQDLAILHLSALDSLAPEIGDRHFPGPITEYSFPRTKRVQMPVFGLGIYAWVFEEDAEAAQALIEREFNVLRRHEHRADWQEAWSRYYRAIYRDSFDRLVDIAFQVERYFNVPAREKRDFAEQVLHWVQSFTYERDFTGSDFVNAISAAIEGRGDCDSRAMLWAVVLQQAGIPAAIMVSREFSHAMGLADVPGWGARFEVGGQRLLVAETTANVGIGLIEESVSIIDYWLGILFE